MTGLRAAMARSVRRVPPPEVFFKYRLLPKILARLGSLRLPRSACTATPASVSSAPGAGGPRHVGRVVDPSVRDDGDPEPDLQLASEAAADEAAPEGSARAPRKE